MNASYYVIDPKRKGNNFEVFGLDIMIDSDFRPWLIEVNTNPCLELSSPVLSRVIPRMLDNAFAYLSHNTAYPSTPYSRPQQTSAWHQRRTACQITTSPKIVSSSSSIKECKARNWTACTKASRSSCRRWKAMGRMSKLMRVLKMTVMLNTDNTNIHHPSS